MDKSVCTDADSLCYLLHTGCAFFELFDHVEVKCCIAESAKSGNQNQSDDHKMSSLSFCVLSPEKHTNYSKNTIFTKHLQQCEQDLAKKV